MVSGCAFWMFGVHLATARAPLFAGAMVYKPDGKPGDANPRVLEALKAAGGLLANGRLKHSYPHSWRSKAPLIFRTTPQWFISMETNDLRTKALAAIHAVPTAGLPELVTSSALTELEKYEAVYRGSGAERPIFEAAIRFLRDRAPPLETPVLVHGDFRNGNIMVHPEQGLVGVLDWELAHLGDPAEDMGWICTRSWRFGGGKPVGGFGDYADLLDAYHAAGGREVSLERVLYWEMLGSLKWGCMCLTMYMAYASGADASVERAMIGRRASETEIDLVALLEQAA